MFFPVLLLGLHQVPPPVSIFEDLRVGKGREAQTGDLVRIHVSAKTTDGKPVVDTQKRGMTVSFQVTTGEKPTWRSVVAGMKPGGVRRVQIVSSEEWGPQGNPPIVEAGTVLIVTVRMVDSKPGEVTRTHAG